MPRARNLVTNRLLAAGLTLASGAAMAVAVAPPAQASVYPASPSGVRLHSVGSSSITVGSASASGARRYRLYASTVRADLFSYNIHSARSTRHMGRSRSPMVTVSGLPTTSAPYYWRYATARHGHIRLSHNIYVSYLRPPTPARFRSMSAANGYFLSWVGVPVTSYEIWMSGDPTFRTRVRVWKVQAPANQFTPYGLGVGGRYYFRLRSMNGAVGSLFTPTVSIVARTNGQQVRTATYNIMVRSSDGHRTTGETVADWDTKRRFAAAALLQKADAEVIAVQEGSQTKPGDPRGSRGPRQVDDLASTLGSNYTVALTEPRGNIEFSDFLLTGNYVIYRNDLFRPGVAGHFASNGEWVAAYQMLQRIGTGATFLFVSVHLRVGQTARDDAIRLAQMSDIIKMARQVAWSRGVRAVVYAGDTNSLYARWHLNDGPGRAATANFLGNARLSAPFQYNTDWNSFNNYQRLAPRKLGSIDRIFGDPVVSLMSYSVLMDLDRSGRFIGTIPSDHNPVFSVAVIPYLPYGP